jgi:hypothetical protein
VGGLNLIEEWAVGALVGPVVGAVELLVPIVFIVVVGGVSGRGGGGGGSGRGLIGSISRRGGI